MISDAVGIDRISTVVGYNIIGVNLAESSPNLPQRIAILAQGNDANQATMPTTETVLNSAAEAAEKFGAGSPIHRIMRILRPLSGDGVGGIPTVVYPQLNAGLNAQEAEIIATGTADKNATHYVVVNGRDTVDGFTSAYNVEVGDTALQIHAKIASAISSVYASPVDVGYDVTAVTTTSKWAGETSNEINFSIDTDGEDAGITYATSITTAGTGVPSIGSSLLEFGEKWNTIVINSYGANTTVMDALCAFNGVPSTTSPTGRYSGIVMKPFIAITGSTLEEPTDFTGDYSTEVTIAVAPAPLSKGFGFEAAANMAVLFGVNSQNTPHSDIINQVYPDMPTPDAIGTMSDYQNRDWMVKDGCSTVELSGGKYKVKDFVTTYSPEGVAVPQFRWCRTLIVDFNIRYGYYLLEEANVVGKTIVSNDDVVTAGQVIKPKQWLAILSSYYKDLAKRALIVDPAYSLANTETGISTVNPSRLETKIRYKRTSVARISSTDGEAGFNFGTI